MVRQSMIDFSAFSDEMQKIAGLGAAVGAGLGAVGGAATAGEGNRLSGALVGGALGAGAGVGGSRLFRGAVKKHGLGSAYAVTARTGNSLPLNKAMDALPEAARGDLSKRVLGGAALATAGAGVAGGVGGSLVRPSQGGSR